jgi:internalin A
VTDQLPEPQVISPDEVDAVIARARDEQWTQLALIGLAGNRQWWIRHQLDEGWDWECIFFLESMIEHVTIRSLSELSKLRSLNIGGNGFGENGAKELAALTNLTSLHLSSNGIGVEGAKALAALTNLTSLNLDNNSIGVEGAKALAALTNLTSLNLDNNSIGVEGAKALAALANLNTLDLSHNGIGDQGAKALAALANLTSLNLGINGIGVEGAKALAALANLNTLDLSHNGIGDQGAKELAALTNLKSLNLWNNSIGVEGAKALAALANLNTLDLSHNGIGDQGAKALAALSNLTSLHLSSNGIGVEGAKALAALTNLTSLNLDNNSIGVEGAKALAALTNLTSLNLDNNSIGVEGAKALAALANLNTLDLSHNGIGDQGAKALAALANLTSLNLGINGIGVEGAKALAALANLNTLDLSHNGIGDQGAKELAALTNLKSLNLWNNSIGVEGAKALAALANLNTLDLSHNGIGDQGAKALAALSNLTSLHLSSNGIGVEGAKALAALTNLTSLNLDNNSIGVEGAKALAALTNLTSLNLDNNSIGVEGAKALAALANLNTLDLSHNGIGDQGAKALAALANLNTLDLSHNGIGDQGAKELAALTNLKSLNLWNNGIGDQGAKALAALTNLNSLYLGNNNTGDAGLLSLADGPVAQTLQVLNLDNNPITIVPPELIEQGDAQAIFAALKGRPLNEAKVLVVGEPEAGKTRLIGWLMTGKDPGKPKWTRGVKIGHWPIPLTDNPQAANGEDDTHITAHVWDFGGQEIMQSTHQFFLTERSLYILVLDARHNEDQSRVRHWLEKITAFGGDSPVIIVLNKQDEGSMRPDEKRLRRDYGDILLDSFYPASCETGQGIDDLRAAVQARVRSLEHVQAKISAPFLATKNDLEEKAAKQKHLSRAEYEACCATHGIRTGDDQTTLLETLKALGTLYHYDDARHPHDTAATFVLEPEWVTRGVYGVLTSPVLKQSGGVLDAGKLDQYFEFDEKDEYPPDKQKFILGMMTMDQFELAFAMPDRTGHYLVPEQLHPDEIDHGIEPTETLNFEYEYEYMPAGIIPRFIVRMHHDLQPGGAWCNGVVLRLEDCRVLVRASREEGRLFISVTGPEERRRAALTCVRDALGGIHDAMKHVKPVAYVPMPDDLSVREMYEHLRDLECDPEAGPNHRFKPAGAKRWYTVRELLDGVDERENPDRRTETDEPPATTGDVWKKIIQWFWRTRFGQFIVVLVVILIAVIGGGYFFWNSFPDDTKNHWLNRIGLGSDQDTEQPDADTAPSDDNATTAN